MHKSLALVLFFLCTAFAYSQNITINGKITDPDDFPLEAATIYLSSAKDSTLIDYTISDSNGNWTLKIRQIEEPVFLKVSYVSYANYNERLESVTEDKDFGTIKLSDQSTELGELVIEGEVPPITVKSDTLEFNAASFKVRPDANVQSLLKQLPGVEIDAEGKITVNGKEVNQILVNGKPFFDKDGKVALQNLPSEIIDKIQVSDTKTKQEELSGQKASGDSASINLTIDEDKNKGLFGKFMGGYGTDDRYESSAIFNYFKNDRKISVLASSNNINSTGFSMNEIFDSMGGGRNNSLYTYGNGGFAINGMRFGGGQGITLSNMLGVNYADVWFKDFDSNISYFYNSADTENENRTRQENFLPSEEGSDSDFDENSFITESRSSTKNTSFAHNFNTQFEFKIDSTSTIFFQPKLVMANSKSRRNSDQFSTDGDNQLLNESTANNFDETDNMTISNELYYYKSFKRKGRFITASLNNDNRKEDASELNESTTIFYEDTDGDGITDTTTEDIRNQIRYNRQTSDNYTASVEYFEPVSDSLRLKVAVNYELERNVQDREGFDYNPATDEYSEANALLTNYLSSKANTFTPTAGFNIEKNKLYLGTDFGTAIVNFNNYSSYLGSEYTLNRQYLLPSANAYANYKFTKSRSVYVNYGYEFDLPAASQILPVEDLSNPLYTSIGNPDLDPNKFHTVYLGFRDYDYATRSGYNFYGGGQFYDSQVTQATTIDASAKQTTTYVNVSGNYNAWYGGHWSKSLKREMHTLRLGLGFSGGVDKSKGFTNGLMFESRGIRLSPRIDFTYEYGQDLVIIKPSYRYNYNQTNFSNYRVNSASWYTHNVNLETTTYWPKNLVWGNDFGYTYNSNISDGFRKDFFLWNSSIGYNFLGEKLLFKVKVYDLLNQNLSATRTISPTTIRDEENIVLQRYVMFSLTYKIEKFGGKKKDGGGRFTF